MRGNGERPLRITLHSQSLIDLSNEEKLAEELLREFANLPELEVIHTSADEFPNIVVHEPDLINDYIPVDLVRQDRPPASTYVSNTQQWPVIVNGLAKTNGTNDETVQDMTKTLIWAQAHRAVKSDILVTKSSFLLEHRDKSFVRETNPRTPLEAAKIVGLFLRSRNNYVYRTEQKIKMAFNRGLFFWILARYRFPNMWKYFSACVTAAKTQNENLLGLGESILIRSVRALEALDAIGTQFYLPQNNDIADQMMYHFDYLTLVLSGALDAQARIANRVYQINKTMMNVGFQKGSFVEALKSEGAQVLYDCVKNQKFQNLKTLLYELRNTIHAASLKTIAYQESAQAIQYLVKLPDDIKNTIWDASEKLGSAQRWGLIKYPGEIFLEPFSYSSALVEEGLIGINEIAAATDMNRLFTNSGIIPHLIDTAPENSHFVWGKRLSLLA